MLRSIVSVPGAEALAHIRTGSTVNALAAAPDGASVAAACADGVLRVYDVATQRLVGGFKVAPFSQLKRQTWQARALYTMPSVQTAAKPPDSTGGHVHGRRAAGV